MAHSEPRRHLPVVGNAAPEPDAPRPIWLWVLLGGIVIVTVWVPLALAAVFLGGKIAASLGEIDVGANLPSQSFFAMVPTALLVLLSLAGAAAIGGAVVGRFAGHRGRWDAAMAGCVSVSFILLLAALGHALRPPLVGVLVALCLLSIAVPSAAFGGRWGRKDRAQNDD